MTRIRHHVGVSGAAIAVTFSLLGHAGVVLVASQHRQNASVQHLNAALPVPETDFVIAQDQPDPSEEQAAQPAPAPAPAPASARVPARAVAAHAEAASGPSMRSAIEPAPEPAAPTMAEANAGPHFAMTLAPTVGGVLGVATAALPSSAVGHGSGIGPSGPIATENADIPAKLRVGNVPAYTASALAAGIEANVPLELIISESGGVSSARVLEHVGYGLDEAARQGVLAYRFSPAMRGGKPVAVRMRWLMRFQLR